MAVDRCVCFRITFAELLELAERHGARTVDELQDHVDFGLSCRSCLPYVKEALRTGKTALPVMREPR